tara:strand:+ start:2192 stop:3112 length:921 start_codon:yes stop_codon:yes gene_type:complete
MKKPDQNENNLKDALFKRIESEQVCPKSRFFFLCRECSVWLFWVLSVVVGAMAVAVSLFVVMNRQYAFYEATHDNWLTFMVEALPYLWFLVFGLMAYFATFNIRHTVRGYRYPAWMIVGSSVAMSVVVGVLLQASDLGHVVDNALGTHIKMYMSQEKMEQKLWQAPAEGRLLGQRVFEDTVPSTTVVFVDVDGGRWVMDVSELNERDLTLLATQKIVRLIGRSSDVDSGRFYACGAFPWMMDRAMSLEEMRYERDMFIKRMREHADEIEIRAGVPERAELVASSTNKSVCASIQSVRRMPAKEADR